MARIPRQFFRAGTATLNAYTGPAGEPAFNTDTNRLHMMDGSTAGGHAMRRMADAVGADEVTHTAAASLRDTDVEAALASLAQRCINTIDRTTTAPPVSPAVGDAYIVPGSPSGAWVGHVNDIAVCSDDSPVAWVFITPTTRQRVWNDEDQAFYTWSGSAWVAVGAGVADDSITPAKLDAGTATKKREFLTRLAPATRSITGSASITIADWGRTIYFNSASDITVTIDAVATLTDGFWCRFKNINSGVVTLDPNSSETIDGETTIVVPKGDSGELNCTGSVLHTMERPSIVPVVSVDLAGLASYDVTLPSGFKSFRFEWQNIVIATTSRYVAMVLNGGSGFDTGSTDYTFSGNGGAGSNLDNLALGTTAVNTAGIGCSGSGVLNPGKASTGRPQWNCITTAPPAAGGSSISSIFGGERHATYRTAVARVIPSGAATTFTSGLLQVYGQR